MFTPPPSPLPSPKLPLPPSDPLTNEEPAPSPGNIKRRIGRRWKWTAVLGPLILVLITLSTRYITHPAVFDILDNVSPVEWTPSDWSPHKRHLDPRDLPSSSTGPSSSSQSSATPTATVAETAQPIPTVPTSSTVPTPFPQPWDSNIQKNFSSTSCFNFFSNMTNTAPFRSCRPFSLLLQSSSALVEAQNNLTLLNSIIWGTCQTTTSFEQCSLNMGWFAQDLQVACAQDLSDRNANAVMALIGLQAYDLMYTAGCLSDPNTNTYCYLNAVHNSIPSDVYMYQLPLGLTFPKTATPTCSTCAKSLMAVYANGLQNATTGSHLSALATSYPGAAQLATKACGSSYAKSLGSGGDSRPIPMMGVSAVVFAMTLAMTVLMEMCRL